MRAERGQITDADGARAQRPEPAARAPRRARRARRGARGPPPPRAQGAADRAVRCVLNRWVCESSLSQFAQQTVRGLFCGRVEPDVTTVKAV